MPARTSPTLPPHPLALCCHYPVSKYCSASIVVTSTLRVIRTCRNTSINQAFFDKILCNRSCVKRPLKGPKNCGLLTQVNCSENCTFGNLKGQSLDAGGLQTQVVLRAGSTVLNLKLTVSTIHSTESHVETM